MLLLNELSINRARLRWKVLYIASMYKDTDGLKNMSLWLSKFCIIIMK